jgi:hypothetical protein
MCNISYMSDSWLMLVASLTGRSPAPRMRLWRALKGAGAAALPDTRETLPGRSGLG